MVGATPKDEERSYMELRDKVALITGAAQGIGRAMAEAFAREGAKVALNDVNQELVTAVADRIRASGSDSVAIVADTSDRLAVEKMFHRILQEFGKLDVLVNNAGITRDAFLHKMTEEQWRTVIDINLTGVFFCLQAGANIMREAGSGSIINISSDARFGNIGQSNYSASKEGIVGLTRTAAREFARKNVRVNAISPGPINTEMLRAVPEKAMEKLLASVPMGRVGTVEELSELALFLASDRSSYITGQVINCDGGWFMC